MNGRYKYENAISFNSKWLKRDKEGYQRPDESRVRFEPPSVWIEDRWMFIRRMAGDELCQKLFYKVCAFIWAANDITLGENIQKYQDAVITEIFGYTDKRDFLRTERQPTEVTTWDGKDRALISHSYLERMATEIGILGPLAAVYGRDLEQLLMGPNPPTIIPEKLFNESITFGRFPLRSEALK